MYINTNVLTEFLSHDFLILGGEHIMICGKWKELSVAALIFFLTMGAIDACAYANEKAASTESATEIEESEKYLSETETEQDLQGEKSADNQSTEIIRNVEGKAYQLKDGKYEFPETGEKSDFKESEIHGNLAIKGEISDIGKKKTVPSYGVDGGHLSFSYYYDGTMFPQNTKDEHIVSDKNEQVDGIELDHKVGEGTLLLQTSKDGKIWYTAWEKGNVFSKKEKNLNDFYQTTDIQMTSGCYYRLAVVYKTEEITGEKRSFFGKRDKIKERRYVELYYFYAYDINAENLQEPEQVNENALGADSLVRTKKIKGYQGKKKITGDDPHYGWTMGNFYVGGFSDIVSKDGEQVILKDTGDQISLWFDLKQNIDKCNNDDRITVIDDTEGRDDGFQVPAGVDQFMDFGRGTLFIRKKKPSGEYGKPQIYTNFLIASASTDALTKVCLFEEGEYEVALDYKLKYDKIEVFGKTIVPKYSCYRVYFKFKVANANNMFFIFDAKTGSELANGAIAPDGFQLNLAGSKYLHIHYKREVLTDGYDGLTEDIRHSGSAEDGEVFTDEGIYTISSRSDYSDSVTEKKIYVGTNNILKAYMKSGGSLTIAQIKSMIDKGAFVAEDGTIVQPDLTGIQETDTERVSSEDGTGSETRGKAVRMEETLSAEEGAAKPSKKSSTEQNSYDDLFFIILISVLAAVVIALILSFGRKGNRHGHSGE